MPLEQSAKLFQNFSKILYIIVRKINFYLNNFFIVFLNIPEDPSWFSSI